MELGISFLVLNLGLEVELKKPEVILKCRKNILKCATTWKIN